MAGDETILEGPITPAPIFAYRALRGIFFASPDSSPEHENKENIAPQFAVSPMKSKALVGEQGVLTPAQKKRKFDSHGSVLSPTKGILRTPGLATPRANFIKDINVKFKSVSPEVIDKKKAEDQIAHDASTRLKESGVPVRSSKSVNDLNALRKPQFTQTKSIKHSTIQSLEEAPTKSAPTASMALTNVISPFTIETYRNQTEKEMKKLLRYGQKMREYARIKDTENQELKSMVEHLQRENERLRKLDAARNGEVETEKKARPGRDQGRERISSSSVPISVASGMSQSYVREEVDKVEATVRSQRRTKTLPQRPRSSQQKRHVVQRNEEQDNDGNGDAGARHLASSHITPSKQPVSPPGHPHPQPLRVRAASATAPADAVSGVSAGTLRLAPDRVAAARDRLRRRAELRRASAENIQAASMKTHTRTQTGTETKATSTG